MFWFATCQKWQNETAQRFFPLKYFHPINIWAVRPSTSWSSAECVWVWTARALHWLIVLLHHETQKQWPFFSAVSLIFCGTQCQIQFRDISLPSVSVSLHELFLYFILFSHRERFDFQLIRRTHTASCFTLIFNSLGYFSLDYWARWAANAPSIVPPLITKNTPDDDARAGIRTSRLRVIFVSKLFHTLSGFCALLKYDKHIRTSFLKETRRQEAAKMLATFLN